jgi:hypothetical protein
LKVLYGISMSDYRAMLAQQGGSCAICRTEPVSRKLSVDHDGATGLIRGLLCNGCNVGLGNFGHSSQRLGAAKEYREAATARPIRLACFACRPACAATQTTPRAGAAEPLRARAFSLAFADASVSMGGKRHRRVRPAPCFRHWSSA